MENIEFYDLIINVDSFGELKNKDLGWKIDMSEKGVEKYNFFSNAQDEKEIEKKDVNRIGMLGASGVGKTFILGKLIKKEELKTNKIETKGISIIYPKIGSDDLFVCIDSQGSEEPIIGSKMTAEEIYKLDEKEKKKIIKDSSKDKKFVEIFIQDFIIDKSNILIVVVDQLKFSEQKLINRLKNHSNFEKLFVIHNLQFFVDIKTINEHIENVIKKSVFSNLEKAFIPYMDDNDKEKKDKPFFFYEKDFGNKDNKSKHETIHLFMAKENSPAGKYFNEETIKYITYLIKAQTNKKVFDVIKEIKEFLSYNSIQYMIKENSEKRPILEEDLFLDENENGKYLKCNKDFKLKDCIINEMGISSFSLQNSINPSFVCYKGNYKRYKKGTKEVEEEWPALIVKTEMFVDPEKIEVLPIINDDYDSMILSIYCKKEIKNDENIKDIEFLDGDIREGEIRIDIKFNFEEIVLDPSIKYFIRQLLPGIILIYLKIVDDKKTQEFKAEIIKKKRIHKN